MIVNRGRRPIELATPRNVSISLTQTIVRTLQHMGINNTDQLLTSVDIDPLQLDNTDNRIPFENQQKFWMLAYEAAGTDDFPILFAQQSQFATFNMAGHIATNVKTMGDSWDATEKYQELAGQGGKASIHRTDTTVIMSYLPFAPNNPSSDVRSCSILSAIINIGRWMIGPIYTPLKVEFSIAPPADISLYQKFFKCPLLFNQTVNRITFDREIENIRIPYANLEVLKMMREKADKIIVELNADDSFSRQVSLLITSTLMHEEPDKTVIAAQLNISPRTLQRKLAKEDTSYQQLLDQIRYQLAQNYLQDTQLTVTDIAYMLGFTEPSAFYRAFKKWHGMTPGQYREKHDINKN